MVAAIPGRHRITVGGDKHFDTAGFVAALKELNATPHVAQNTSKRRRSSALFPQPVLMFAVKYLVASVQPALAAGGMFA